MSWPVLPVYCPCIASGCGLLSDVFAACCGRCGCAGVVLQSEVLEIVADLESVTGLHLSVQHAGSHAVGGRATGVRTARDDDDGGDGSCHQPQPRTRAVVVTPCWGVCDVPLTPSQRSVRACSPRTGVVALCC